MKINNELVQQVNILEKCLQEAPVDFLGTGSSPVDEEENLWYNTWRNAIKEIRSLIDLFFVVEEEKKCDPGKHNYRVLHFGKCNKCNGAEFIGGRPVSEPHQSSPPPTAEGESEDIEKVVVEIMKKDPKKAAAWMAVVFGRECVKANADEMETSLDADMPDGKRYKVTTKIEVIDAAKSTPPEKKFKQ